MKNISILRIFFFRAIGGKKKSPKYKAMKYSFDLSLIDKHL